MKIATVSDLHLDFKNVDDSVFENKENAEILLIAGDTCESKSLVNFKNTFKKICKNYKEVFVIAGNHEFYKNFYADTLEQIENFAKNFDNLYFLNDKSINIENWLLIGSTLWTDFNKGNPLAMSAAKDCMNDYKYIKIIKNGYRKLSPKDTLDFHFQSKRFIESELIKNKNKKAIVLTHHAPTLKSSIDNKVSYEDYAFVSDLSDLILDNSQIKYWIHGHTHSFCNYDVGNCRVISNPRGYPSEESSDFRPLIFEI